MTQKLSYGIHWLAFSEPGFAPLSEVIRADWTTITGKSLMPLRGYNRALGLEIGRVDWHSERPTQRRLWTLTGSDLDKIATLDFGAQQDLIDQVSRVEHVSVTRLDFAADIKGANASPGDIERAWDEGRVITKAKMIDPREKRNKAGQGQGKTVYIGSRTSEKCLRIYDKGAESGTHEDHCRVEMETKSAVANMACQEMARIKIGPAGCALVRDFCAVPTLEWYSDLLSGAGEADFTIGRKVTNWEAWITAVALPNVIKAIQEDVPNVRSAIRRAMAQVDKTCTEVVH